MPPLVSDSKPRLSPRKMNATNPQKRRWRLFTLEVVHADYLNKRKLSLKINFFVSIYQVEIPPKLVIFLLNCSNIIHKT